MTVIEILPFILIVVSFAAGYLQGRIVGENIERKSRIVNDAELIAKARREKQ